VSQSMFIRGAGLILASELFLVLSGVIIKQISTDLPTEVIVLFRNLFALVVLLPWLIRKGLKVTRTQLLHFHFLRALVGVSAMSCLYYAWANLPLAQAALLKQTAPFFVPLFAFWWLGERVHWSAKLAIVIGFAGVYAVLNPHEGSINHAVLIALFGAMLGAFAKVVIRRMTVSESSQVIVFYFALFSTLLAAIPALLVWTTPSWVQWAWLFSLAGTSTIAQLLLSHGYRFAPAGQLGPFTYGSIVFATLLGWWLWGETLELHTWVGIALILAAGLLTAYLSPSRKPVQHP
jgi:drug/metabolite transporter (DMT)-like permease